jgi:hypothetical protein
MPLIPPTLSTTLVVNTVTAEITATEGVMVDLYRYSAADEDWILAGSRPGSGTIVVSGLAYESQQVFEAF